MKKFFNSLMICLIAVLCIGTGFVFAGCNFEVNYKTTAEKLTNAVQKLNNKNFTSGEIRIDGTVIDAKKLPNYSSLFVSSDYYTEINVYYDSIFSFSLDYISDSIKILETKPTVETLTESQEDLYALLNEQIDDFSNSIDAFKSEIENVNKRFDESENYSENKDLFVLNFKRAYRDVIYDVFELSNSVEDVLAKVYSKIDYEELSTKKGTTFKSLKNGFDIRIFEGYFSLIIDSYDCQIPTKSIDANQYMNEMLSLYNTAKNQYKNFYTKISTASGTKTLTADEIEKAQETIGIYFEETELFQDAYEKLNYKKFFFDDDCNLEEYENKDYSNRHYYNKIKDYVKNTLPELADYVFDKFFIA